MGASGLVRPWAVPRQAAPGNQNALEVDFTRLGSIELGTLSL